MTEQLYKVLRREGDALISCHGGTGHWTLNRWRSVSGELNPCKHGLHLCREGDLVRWLGEVICTAEYSGERIDCIDKVVVRRARITSVCEHWTERTQRLFAVDCTRLIANRYTEEDQRERLHAVLDVMVTIEKWELDRELWAAARAAAWAAAWGAARGAARAAARAAAWDAARVAARGAARAEQTAILMRYLAGEEGPFVEEGAP